MMRAAFGIFDHVDRGDEPIGTLYEQRLQLVETADGGGFRSYHVAEHHATPLGMAPSPSVYLAAVAQRTRRLRFGPLVYLLPLYTPLRLIEEICMLDQLSGGRLELGVGRGISPYELAYSGVDFLAAQEIYEESLEIILAGLRGGRLTHHGRHYTYRGVPMELEPVQKPHPPLWQGVVRPDGAADAARRGVNIVSTLPGAALRSLVDAYFEAHKPGPGVPEPLVGMQRSMFVADTDAEALKLARPAYERWYASLTQLWRQFNTVPIRFADTLERAIQQDTAIVGSPSTVRAEVERHLATTGCNYFVGRFLYGNPPFEAARHSVELFAREVIPHFTR
ncbi:MAG TPA: LLM class flavin-dependent oxidoreductase [Methylomirabilota bacterium]|jgi:alkanesulfonate monooxygenase SsuD/methylene tetrahydromethanopterin reductase-like flavin-dependent oxidoreductase (luciferase family)|nr:LLM class flavin-dependent oxidoreductase [Methylomirabilota bacterium]